MDLIGLVGLASVLSLVVLGGLIGLARLVGLVDRFVEHGLIGCLGMVGHFCFEGLAGLTGLAASECLVFISFSSTSPNSGTIKGFPLELMRYVKGRFECKG